MPRTNTSVDTDVGSLAEDPPLSTSDRSGMVPPAIMETSTKNSLVDRLRSVSNSSKSVK